MFHLRFDRLYGGLFLSIGYTMPYTPAQNRLFWAASKNEAIAKEHGLSMGKAEELAKEGVKKTKSNPKKLAKALMKKLWSVRPLL